MTALDRTTFETLIEALPADRRAARESAFSTFENAAMPTEKAENWKYVDLSVDLAETTLVPTPGESPEEGEFLAAVTDRAATVRIVDGHVVSIDGSPDGVSIKRLGDVDASTDAAIRTAVDPGRDIFAAARSSFADDGIVVEVERNRVVDGPVVIDLASVTAGYVAPFVVFKAGENSEADLIIVYRSTEVAAISNPLVWVEAGQAARVRMVSVQAMAQTATSIVHQLVVTGRDSSVKAGDVGLGGHLGRLDTQIILEGDGSSAEVVGVYFGEHDQTLDYRMVMNHVGKRTSSDVFLKGAVEDHAQAVFTGLLKIEEGAIRSSAFETNRNLVLSEGAKANSVPNLEILCDDVVCGHGSSVGPLEGEHLYYLQSRGLPKERAERMLIRGFFQEVIDRFPVHGLEEPVQHQLFARFIEAQEEGRVA